MKQLDVAVYQSETAIIITGNPEEHSDHNCDEMGCGSEHVLYRFPLSESTQRMREEMNYGN